MPWDTVDPIAATMAGVLAGAAALPVALRRLDSTFGLRAPARLRARPDQISVSFSTLPHHRLDAGVVDVVSADAITNACLFVLLRTDITGSLRIFDDDRFEPTNLNRYALLRRSDLGRLKINRLQDFSSADSCISGRSARYPTPGEARPSCVGQPCAGCVHPGTDVAGDEAIPTISYVQCSPACSKLRPSWSPRHRGGL